MFSPFQRSIMRSRFTVLVRLLPCVATLALGACAHDPDTVISAALSNFEHHTGGGRPHYREFSGGHAAEDIAWGAPTVHPAAYGSPEPSRAYLLDTGDRLRVFVYGQPNLSRAYTVDHDGLITVPLIGDVKARGRTTRNVEETIRRRLGAEFVRDPQVTVDVLQNRPFFIYGEVKAAGQYPFVSGMTVETAIAIAGGYSERASTRSFRITRRSDGIVDQMEAPGDYPLQPGDTVYVNERFF